MARPIWKGHITFGLVNIPVELYSGEVRADLHFSMLDSRNNARVRYQRVNDITGEEVPWDKIVKAFEYDKGNYIVLQEEELDKFAVEATQTIDIEDFVDQEAIDYVYYDKPYFLVPGKKGEKGYVLLREALKRSKKIGVARVVIRKNEHLAAVIPEGPALVLDLLRFHHEVRDTSEFDLPAGKLEQYKIQDKEIGMAEQLINSMTSDWEPKKYKDEYRIALIDWIKKKAEEDGEVSAPEPEVEAKPAGEIIDIMDLLQKSVQRTEERRGASKPAPAKSAAKAPVKKSAAKAKAAPKTTGGGRKKAG